MLEKLPYPDNCQVLGKENLKLIAKLNQEEGTHFIFAPNHLKPSGRLATLREMTDLADDYPMLNEVLEQAGLDSKVIFRGDTDMEIGESRLQEVVYNIQKTIISALGRLVTGGIPLAINDKAPKQAMLKNHGNVKEIIATAKKANLTIYPYGKWFESGEQTFDSTIDLKEGQFFPSSAPLEDKTPLKSGFIRLSELTKSPIVPVYVVNHNGKWVINFGEFIEVSKKSDRLAIAKKYLAEMQALKKAADDELNRLARYYAVFTGESPETVKKDYLS